MHLNWFICHFLVGKPVYLYIELPEYWTLSSRLVNKKSSHIFKGIYDETCWAWFCNLCYKKLVCHCPHISASSFLNQAVHVVYILNFIRTNQLEAQTRFIYFFSQQLPWSAYCLPFHFGYTIVLIREVCYLIHTEFATSTNL